MDRSKLPWPGNALYIGNQERGYSQQARKLTDESRAANLDRLFSYANLLKLLQPRQPESGRRRTDPETASFCTCNPPAFGYNNAVQEADDGPRLCALHFWSRRPRLAFAGARVGHGIASWGCFAARYASWPSRCYRPGPEELPIHRSAVRILNPRPLPVKNPPKRPRNRPRLQKNPRWRRVHSSSICSNFLLAQSSSSATKSAKLSALFPRQSCSRRKIINDFSTKASSPRRPNPTNQIIRVAVN